jgi:ABC-type glycerol-3-phosphate transport system permease component
LARSCLLQAIAAAGATSRAMIARAANFSPPTLSSIVGDLVDEGFIDGMGDAFINNIIVAVPATTVPVTIAAFAFAWVEFPAPGGGGHRRCHRAWPAPPRSQR